MTRPFHLSLFTATAASILLISTTLHAQGISPFGPTYGGFIGNNSSSMFPNATNVHPSPIGPTRLGNPAYDRGNAMLIQQAMSFAPAPLTFSSNGAAIAPSYRIGYDYSAPAHGISSGAWTPYSIGNDNSIGNDIAAPAYGVGNEIDATQSNDSFSSDVTTVSNVLFQPNTGITTGVNLGTSNGNALLHSSTPYANAPPGNDSDLDSPYVTHAWTASDPNAWRMVKENGQWWYWAHGNYWMYYQNGVWNRYNPPTGFAPPAEASKSTH